MKNIHILSTDKPSRLYLTTKEYILDKEYSASTDECSNKNIYITSDEEIKDKDYYWDENKLKVKRYFKNRESYPSLIHRFKIILTTDRDLIKDGVQAIDDEFLGWFVQNPSYKEVEVESKVTKDGVWTDLKGYVELPTIHSINYKIIIPKKDLNPFELPKALPNNVLYESLESKQEITLEEVAERLKGKELFKESNDRARKVLSEIKSLSIAETPEEAAQKRFPINNNLSILERMGLNSAANMEFIEGAKWQAERSYSEKEVIRILIKAYEDVGKRKIPNQVVLANWFEQFKKK